VFERLAFWRALRFLFLLGLGFGGAGSLISGLDFWPRESWELEGVWALLVVYSSSGILDGLELSISFLEIV
jgi:hypothetical protein